MSGWRGVEYIGNPVPAMLCRVKEWVERGLDVRIFTARVSLDGTVGRAMQVEAAEAAIREWCVRHIGRVLPITCVKDFGMIELYDDRCKQVIPNTGLLMEELNR